MSLKKRAGRQREAAVIRQANRAAAVGRLMLGELTNWNEFLAADTLVLEDLPRRQLKAGRSDVKVRLKSEINDFCNKNFRGLEMSKLSSMYEVIKAHRGLEMPLHEFESSFATVRPDILHGSPKHLTVSISLWGFQLRFPEDDLAKDIREAISLTVGAKSHLVLYENKSHAELLTNRDHLQVKISQELFAARAALVASFNLMEAYLNGLAWDFVQSGKADTMSKRKRNLLDDSASVSIRDKLLKYPEIISGVSLWTVGDEQLESFLDIVKPFRDSLVHASPFTAPAKFGGYDKLKLLYRIESDTAIIAVFLTVSLIERIQMHIHGAAHQFPLWLLDLRSSLECILDVRGKNRQLTSEFIRKHVNSHS